MNLDRIGRSVLFAGFVALLGGCASMDEGTGGKPAGAPKDPMQEMQEWMALHTPNEHHEWLQSMAGTYDVILRHWMTPDAPPGEMTATSVITPVLGGRYLREDVTSEFMGVPFSGMAIIGHDNQAGEYFTIWMDSMSTNYMVSRGTRSEDGVLVMHGDMPEPGGGTHPSRSVLRVTDGGMDMEIHEDKTGTGMVKTMEGTYRRRK